MVQQVNLALLAMPGSHMGTSSAAPLLIELPANALGERVDDGPSTWTPAHTWKTWIKLLAPGLGLLAFVATWE